MRKKKIEGLLLGESAPRRPGMSGILLDEAYQGDVSRSRSLLGAAKNAFARMADYARDCVDALEEDPERHHQGRPAAKVAVSRMSDAFQVVLNHLERAEEETEETLHRLDQATHQAAIKRTGMTFERIARLAHQYEKMLSELPDKPSTVKTMARSLAGQADHFAAAYKKSIDPVPGLSSK